MLILIHISSWTFARIAVSILCLPNDFSLTKAMTTILEGDITSAAFQANRTFCVVLQMGQIAYIHAPSPLATWSLYYSVRATYGPLVGLGATDALTPSFWHKVTQAFETNDAAFRQYNTFLSRGLDVAACDATCKAKTICGLRAQRAENNCVCAVLYRSIQMIVVAHALLFSLFQVVTSPGLNVKRSDDAPNSNSAARTEPCEGTSLAHIFAKLPAAFVRIVPSVVPRSVLTSRLSGQGQVRHGAN